MKRLFYFDESDNNAFEDAFFAASDGQLAGTKYRLVASFDGKTSLSEIFGFAGNDPNNSANWYSQYGERSMSVGDVVHDTETGLVHICQPVGWHSIPCPDGKLLIEVEYEGGT